MRTPVSIVKIGLSFLFAAAAFGLAAAPMLKSQAELVADGRFKLKTLANAEGVPPPTPRAKTYVATRTSSDGTVERETKKVYDEKELAFVAELLGMWKDRKGNVMRLAKPEKYPWDADARHAVAKTIDGATYRIDFIFAETVTDAQAKKLLKAASASLSTRTGGISANHSSMKWWERETEEYRFLTDLDKAKGGKFVQDAMRLMDAMRKSYEFYVPPQKPVGRCTVRVFKTLAGYRSYRASTGDKDEMSCGLWDPNREELLVAAEDRDQAQRTMRHEAFHQYLHYATGNGFHAPWFNEGHACFFEEVKYNPAKNTVKVVDGGNRATWVGRNPALHARMMKSLLKLSHEQFYSGDANLNYCTAWAIVYFLEKGAYTSKKFEPYRTIVPTYLKLTAAGTDAATATERAWAAVADRDLAEDFLEFWKDKRKAAVNAR